MESNLSIILIFSLLLNPIFSAPLLALLRSSTTANRTPTNRAAIERQNAHDWSEHQERFMISLEQTRLFGAFENPAFIEYSRNEQIILELDDHDLPFPGAYHVPNSLAYDGPDNTSNERNTIPSLDENVAVAERIPTAVAYEYSSSSSDSSSSSENEEPNTVELQHAHPFISTDFPSTGDQGPVINVEASKYRSKHWRRILSLFR